MAPGFLLLAALWAAAADGAVLATLQRFEVEIAQQPEDLVLASEYRQAAVATGQFDRSIDFFEKLARRKGSGPNVQISLALALVDKAPAVGEVRRTYVGFDAMNALTRAIAQQPSALAYYIRGRINLDYDKLIFHRTDKGVADLEQALTLVTPATSPSLVARIYTSLGDGYYKLDDPARAQGAWTAGLHARPDDAELQARIEKSGTALRDLVHDALAPSRRVDTSLTVTLIAR